MRVEVRDRGKGGEKARESIPVSEGKCRHSCSKQDNQNVDGGCQQSACDPGCPESGPRIVPLGRIPKSTKYCSHPPWCWASRRTQMV